MQNEPQSIDIMLENKTNQWNTSGEWLGGARRVRVLVCTAATNKRHVNPTE